MDFSGKLNGLDVDSMKAQFEQDVNDIIKVETDLAKIFVPSTERRNHVKQYNPMMVRDLKVKCVCVVCGICVCVVCVCVCVWYVVVCVCVVCGVCVWVCVS